MPLDLQLRHLNMYQFTARQLILHCQPRHQGDSIAHRHKSLDGLQAWQLDIHIQRRLMFLEQIDHPMPQRRDDIVSNKVFRSQIADRHLLLACQWVPRIHHENNGIRVDANQLKLFLRRPKSYDAKLHRSLDNLFGNAAGQSPLHQNADMRDTDGEIRREPASR